MFLIVYFEIGYDILLKAFKGIKNRQPFDECFLMAVATVGALALGRYVDDIRAGGDYEMLAVLNASRPLTRTPQDAVGVLREIEAACRLPFTGLVNNTNLGPQTTPDVVLASIPYADAVSAATGLPIRFTSVAAPLAAALEGKVENLLPLDLQHLYYMMD